MMDGAYGVWKGDGDHGTASNLQRGSFAVFNSGSPSVEHGNPKLGWIWLLQSVTPEPVSNRARIFLPPIDILAFCLEYSGLEVLKQLKAVRHVRRLWGMNHLIAIPLCCF